MPHRELGWSVAGVAAAAAGLGYWLFGSLGVALWVPLAASATLLIHFVRRFVAGLAMAAPLLIAGAALYDASTLAWGGADSPDGTRYKASPIGLSHVLSPRQPVSPTVNCRWHFAGGDAGLCAMAPGAELAYRQLLAVFPLVCGAITVCLIASVAQCRHAWRRRHAGHNGGDSRDSSLSCCWRGRAWSLVARQHNARARSDASSAPGYLWRKTQDGWKILSKTTAP